VACYLACAAFGCGAFGRRAAAHDSQRTVVRAVVKGGVFSAVTVVPLRGDRKRAAAAIRSVGFLPILFRRLLEAKGGDSVRRRHKTTQLRVRERHHPRSWSLSAASAGSNSATRRRGGGVNGSESAGRGICCRKLCYFLNKAGDRAPAAASHHIHHAAQRLVM